MSEDDFALIGAAHNSRGLFELYIVRVLCCVKATDQRGNEFVLCAHSRTEGAPSVECIFVY